jgi:two-component system, NarL family, sensor kinase
MVEFPGDEDRSRPGVAATDPRRRRFLSRCVDRFAGSGRGWRAGGVLGAVVKFAVSGLVVVVLVGVVGSYVVRREGEIDATDAARQVARVLGVGVVQPLLSDALLRGDRAAIGLADAVVHERVLGGPVVRVKVWTADGRIVYSDARQLIGSRYPLGVEERAAFRTGSLSSRVTDLSRPENRFERSFGSLLEVDQSLRTPTGRSVLLEVYMREAAVATSSERIWAPLVGVLAAALVVLWLFQIPLAASLARRLRAGQHDRETLLLRALTAEDRERRRIASDLHDGVVQDLAGVSLSLSATRDNLRSLSSVEVEQVLDQSARATRQGMRRLRSLLVEIYPASLEQAGLEAALRDLLAPIAGRGVETELDCTTDGSLPTAVQQIVFRAAQEALRNVARHADATHVRVGLTRNDTAVRLTVEDNGVGFEPAGPAGESDSGHVGLRLLGDRAADLGGSLFIASAPGSGTTVTLELPLS